MQGRTKIKGTYIPDDELVVILTAERGQELFVVAEGEGLDQNLVQLEALHNLKRVEVPDDDVRLQPQSARATF